MHDNVVPFSKIEKRVSELASDLGFEIMDFAIKPPKLDDPDGLTRATMVLELVDPDRKPDTLVIQIEQGMNEAAVAAWKADQEKKAEAARKELEGDDKLDNKKLRGSGTGFL